ncbi:DUF3054 domain-containing protein [Sinomonas sp. JGH33]|uniref:DUF3054 domain-containing protein n=1 Tax=Sinomonas terricola TaxID=3110330 RepID=A0ABU5TCF3_9MICC|nr:DUF3054 domain-containing protein [Sinomonas sp. JGH33]MEA5457374.1 DUF3054 domain-containing protein [Sinomonas sp. JGH33]
MPTNATPDVRRVRTARTAYLALAGDAVIVLGFAATGRGFHNEANPVLGVLTTAWPFLVGLAVAWLLPLIRRRPLAVWPAGLVVWLGTYLIGMALRGVTGAGLAVPFLIVAASVLGAAIVGWRVVALLVRRLVRR